MKNIFIILLIIALLGGGVYIFSQKNNSPVSESSEQPSSKTEESIGNNLSSYVSYSKSVFEENKNKRRVLFFYANWCPICLPLDSDFKNNQKEIPADAVVIRVNYNDSDTDSEEKELARNYSITYQHTFVQIDENGKEITKWNGGQTKELLENIK